MLIPFIAYDLSEALLNHLRALMLIPFNYLCEALLNHLRAVNYIESDIFYLYNPTNGRYSI